MISSIFGAVYFKLNEGLEKVRGEDYLRSLSNDQTGIDEKTGVFYSPTYPPRLRKVLNHIGVSADDVFLDYGCGKGLVLRTASEYPYKCIKGIELSDKVYDIAMANKSKMKQGDKIELTCCDARDYYDIDDVTHFYFFNPFPRSVFKTVFDRILDSNRRNDREITVIYRYPLYEDLVITSEVFRVKQTFVPDLFDPMEIKTYSNR